MYVVEFTFIKIVRLLLTAYHQTKTFITNTFLEVLRKERMF